MARWLTPWLLVVLIASLSTLAAASTIYVYPHRVSRLEAVAVEATYIIGAYGGAVHMVYVYVYPVPGHGANTYIAGLVRTSVADAYYEPYNYTVYVMACDTVPPYAAGVIGPGAFNASYAVLVNRSRVLPRGGSYYVGVEKGYLVVIVDTVYPWRSPVEVADLVPPQVFYPERPPGVMFIGTLYLHALNSSKHMVALGYIAERNMDAIGRGLVVYEEYVYADNALVMRAASAALIASAAILGLHLHLRTGSLVEAAEKEAGGVEE